MGKAWVTTKIMAKAKTFKGDDMVTNFRV
ncbi:hypothetical protein CCACVL1_11806 [Corchorus capsularis]|uniref:Uncharacterized protein n=1 Tax=Corchorus capsularis TaxID=210143 RepID=A0A1R3IJF1_COCAP|nr:hypothetical protein CCACVL1_11806 [Corchorus capsularis]